MVAIERLFELCLDVTRRKAFREREEVVRGEGAEERGRRGREQRIDRHFAFAAGGRGIRRGVGRARGGGAGRTDGGVGGEGVERRGAREGGGI